MKNEAMDVIRGTGRVGLVASIILSVATYIFMIGLIGATIIVSKMPKELATVTTYGGARVELDATQAGLDETQVATIEEYLSDGVAGGATISFGRFNFPLWLYDKVNGEATFGGNLSTFALKDLSRVLIVGIIYLAVSAVMFAMNGFFAKALKDCKTPFSQTVVKPLSNFAFMLVIWAFVRGCAFAIIGSAFTGVVALSSSDLVIIVLCIVFFLGVRFFKACAVLAE